MYSTNISLAEFELDENRDPADAELFLGLSIRSLGGRSRNRVIDLKGVEVTDLTKDIGRSTQDLVVITSYSELETYLSMSASAEYGTKSIGIQGSGSYLKTQKTVQYGIYAALKVSAQTKLVRLTNRALRQDVEKDIPKDNKAHAKRQSFFEKWDDSYIEGVTYGGEFIVVMEVTKNSFSEYAAVKAKLEGKWKLNKGSAEYESTRSYLMKRGNISAKTFVRGRAIDPPIAVTVKETETIYNSQDLFTYADGFSAKVRAENVTEPMFFDIVSLKKTDNWPRDVDPIDTSDAQNRFEILTDLLVEAEKLSLQWEAFIDAPHMFEVIGARDNPDLLIAKRAEAQKLLQKCKGVIQGIEDDRRQVLEKPLLVDLEVVKDWDPQLEAFRQTPLMKRRVIPTIVTHAYQIKFRPSGGKGLAPNVNKTYVVDASNYPRLNWFPAEGTGRLQFVHFSVDFGGVEKPVDLGLEYQVKLMEVGIGNPPGRGVPTGRMHEADAVINGQLTSPFSEAFRVWEVRFRLTGLMKDAYFIEYGVHAGEGHGTSAKVCGNTPGAQALEWTYLGNGFHIEGIRLYIAPKY